MITQCMYTYTVLALTCTVSALTCTALALCLHCACTATYHNIGR